ncbi:MAG: hypothetical protein ACI9FJ_001995 [Alteromonadaceae bacterium]|jgi:hypothetical protein
MDFGIAGEGKTDQVTIKLILEGFFDELDDQDIAFLQPHRGATEEAVEGFGSWTNLLSYLKSKRFRDDLVSTAFLIIQVDTDVSEEEGYDVPKFDGDNKPFSVMQLIELVKVRLIKQIEHGQAGFYDEYKQKIVFAISVHSLECWLLNFYTKSAKTGRIQGCENALSQEITRYYAKKRPKYDKTPAVYEKLALPLLKPKNIKKVRNIDISFNYLITQLESIDYSPQEDE